MNGFALNNDKGLGLLKEIAVRYDDDIFVSSGGGSYSPVTKPVITPLVTAPTPVYTAPSIVSPIITPKQAQQVIPQPTQAAYEAPANLVSTVKTITAESAPLVSMFKEPEAVLTQNNNMATVVQPEPGKTSMRAIGIALVVATVAGTTIYLVTRKKKKKAA